MSNLPKEKFVDTDIIEKAQSMIRCNHGDAFISDYLGMEQSQVSSIRARMTRRGSGRPISYTPLPAINDEASLQRYETNCIQSSNALVRRISSMGRPA